MKKVYTANTPVDLAHAQNILEINDIPSQKRNELFPVRGEIPFVECWPELWVIHDKHEMRAKRLLEDELNPPSTGETWRCKQCGETSGDQFTHCWQCGVPRRQ